MRRWLLIVVLFSMLAYPVVAAVPVLAGVAALGNLARAAMYTGRINKAVGVIIRTKNIARIAANDPRWAATYNTIGRVAANQASYGGAAKATHAFNKSTWLALAATLGIAGSSDGSFDFGGSDWKLPDQTKVAGEPVLVQVSDRYFPKAPTRYTLVPGVNGFPGVMPSNYATGSNPYYTSSGTLAGYTYGTVIISNFPTNQKYCVYSSFKNMFSYCGADIDELLEQVEAFYKVFLGTYFADGIKITRDGDGKRLYTKTTATCTSCGGMGIAEFFSVKFRVTGDSSDREFFFGTNPRYPIEVPRQFEADAAVERMTEDQFQRMADPRFLARLIDELWKRAAAEPGYEGIPYSAADPVTRPDVETAMNADPASYPRVGDLFSEARPSPGIQPETTPETAVIANPWSPVEPGASGSPGQITVNVPPIDFGPDPGISQPTLDDPDTWENILKPLLDWRDAWTGAGVGAHASECPKPELRFEAWWPGRVFVIDGHCVLAEQVRPVLQPLMAAGWALAAFLIILTA